MVNVVNQIKDIVGFIGELRDLEMTQPNLTTTAG